jgi:hypothetical protein
MNKQFWQLLPLLLVVVAALAIWRDRQSAPPPAPRAACAKLNNGCALSLNGQELRAGVNGTVRAMQPFEVWVEAPQAKRIEARFTMLAMDMGISAYTLKADANGVFRSKVTLAGCVSGDRDWLMTLNVDGAALSIPFVMDP